MANTRAVQGSITESEILAMVSKMRSSRINRVKGDDIAQVKSGATIYAATDSLVEGTHYKSAWLSPAEIAYKLFARNWSDFIAKNIRPRYALLNLNLRRQSASPGFLQPFLNELDRLFSAHGICLAGGDTTRSPHDAFTLTFFGSQGRFIKRYSARIRVGDLIVQIGAVGGSDFARRLLARNRDIQPDIRRFFARPHLFAKLPQAQRFKATIDQSDSVAKSLEILAAVNRVQISIDVDAIAVHKAKIRSLREILAAAEDLAIFGIVSKGSSSSAFRVIGEIKACGNPGIVYRRRGRVVSFYADSYEHFTKC